MKEQGWLTMEKINTDNKRPTWKIWAKLFKMRKSWHHLTSETRNRRTEKSPMKLSVNPLISKEQILFQIVNVT